MEIGAGGAARGSSSGFGFEADLRAGTSTVPDVAERAT